MYIIWLAIFELLLSWLALSMDFAPEYLIKMYFLHWVALIHVFCCSKSKKQNQGRYQEWGCCYLPALINAIKRTVVNILRGPSPRWFYALSTWLLTSSFIEDYFGSWFWGTQSLVLGFVNSVSGGILRIKPEMARACGTGYSNKFQTESKRTKQCTPKKPHTFVSLMFQIDPIS